MTLKSLLVGIGAMLAALPATSNYGLNSYGFGSGGGNQSTSTYSLEGTAAELSGASSNTSVYTTKPGFEEVQQANVPKIASFDNGSGAYYNKLHFVIDTQSNPTDALYALQISTTSNFSANIFYVKNDLTIGASLVLADYQTYTAWGGASGSNIIGLTANTTYYLRAKATQGPETESGWGPASSATTANPSLAFSVTPTSISLGNMVAGTVATAGQTIDLTFDTNAAAGGDVYISDSAARLFSTLANHPIPSATANLSSASHGYGARVSATGQTSGGPFGSVSPFNGAANNVGKIDAIIQKAFSATAAVIGGTGSLQLKALAAITDPAARDYTDTITLIASANF